MDLASPASGRLAAAFTCGRTLPLSEGTAIIKIMISSTTLVWAAGKRALVVRTGKEGTSVVLEIWGGQSLIRELHVPAKVHGSIFNDGWFSAGVAWDSAEQRIAYVAEACHSLPLTYCPFFAM